MAGDLAEFVKKRNTDNDFSPPLYAGRKQFNFNRKLMKF